MTSDTDRYLRMTRRFAASPERVFDAWIDPDMAAKWLFTLPADESYVAGLDPRVGGRWTITARRGGTDYTAVGEYLEIDRPRRLVFTFAMPQFAPDVDTVTVEFAPDGDGCIMTFTQGELLPGYKEPTEQGWRQMFDALDTTLVADCEV